MSEALELFPLLKEHLAVGFWGSLTIATVLLAFAAVVAVKGEQEAEFYGARKKMIPLLGMIICGLGFVVCAAWFFWPGLPARTGTSATLRVIRLADFSNSLLLTKINELADQLRADQEALDLSKDAIDHDRRMAEFRASSLVLAKGYLNEVCKRLGNPLSCREDDMARYIEAQLIPPNTPMSSVADYLSNVSKRLPPE